MNQINPQNLQMILVQEEPRGPSQLIEIPVPAQAVSKVALPDIQQLRSTNDSTIVIKAIRLITAKVLTTGVISGLANAAIGEMRKVSLVLYCEGWEKAQYIPLLVLNDVADADATTATTIPYRVATTRFANWKNVDWSKSYLVYSNGTPSSGAAYCFMMEVEYLRFNKAGKEIEGAH